MCADTAGYPERATHQLRNANFKHPDLTAQSAISPYRLLQAYSSTQVQHATASSTTVIGASYMVPVAVGGPVDVLWGSPVLLEGEAPVTAGQLLKAGTDGKATLLIDESLAGDTLFTSAVGSAFTNQPSNDGVEVLSSNAGDTTQTVTIYGTTTGTDTFVSETVTLNGTTPVPTVKVNWGQVLGVEKSAVTLGTVTVREASADQTITAAMTAAVLSAGIQTVTNGYTYNSIPTVVADGATTKQLGLEGTDSTGATILDSQALTGATIAAMNSSFQTVTRMFTGDVESSRTVSLALTATAENMDRKVGKALTTQATVGDTFAAIVIPV